MKKLILLLFLLPLFAMGQEDFRPWTLELGLGGHWVDGSCDLDLTNNIPDAKVRARYNLSPTFGVYGSGQYSGLTFDHLGEVSYFRAAIGATMNLSNIFDLHSNTFKVLLNADVGGSRAEHGGRHDNILTTSASIMPIVRLSDVVSLKLEGTSILHYNGSYDFQQRTGLLNTLHVGVMLHLGKNKTRPADWYVDTQVVDNPRGFTTYTHNGTTPGLSYRDNVPSVQTPVVSERLDPCAVCPIPDILEHVYFSFDVDKLDKDALDAIQHIVDNYVKGDHIKVTGHACPSNNPDYNLDLSRRRAEHVKNRLVNLRIPSDKISIEYLGEELDGSHDHDTSRRVDIRLIKDDL